MAAPSSASSRESFVLLIELFSNYSINIGDWQVPDPSDSIHDEVGSFLPKFCSPNDVVNFKFVVGLKPDNLSIDWGISLMDLLTPGQQSILLLNHTFILGSWVRCQH